MTTAPQTFSPSLFPVALMLLSLSWGCSDAKDDVEPVEVSDTVNSEDACTESACGEASEEPEPDTQEPTSNTGAKPGAQPAGSENCMNNEDDDGDGLVDCADPLCFGKAACKEVECDNGKDDDFDGLPDCADSDCDFTLACNPESCASYYDCLVAMGCECTHGLDCPDSESPQYGQCQQKCWASANCSNNCVASLSIETQEKIAELQVCLFDCWSDGENDWQSCFSDICLEEVANCYLVGEFSCEHFFFDCIYGCGGNPLCYQDCYQNLSAQGYIDFISWNQCRIEKCDANGDFTPDSPACGNMAGMFACIDVSGGCIPLKDGGSCGAVIDCVTHCESFADGACLASCIEGIGIPEDRKDLIANTFTCFIEACGTSAPGLVPACVNAAMEDTCKEEVLLCTEAD